jgi:hypothetical protein
MGVLAVFFYLPPLTQQKVSDESGIEYPEFTCAPANAELRFGYTCADLWEAEMIARSSMYVQQVANTSRFYLIAYGFVNKMEADGGLSDRYDPVLNFLSVEGKYFSVSVDLQTRSVIEISRPRAEI